MPFSRQSISTICIGCGRNADKQCLFGVPPFFLFRRRNFVSGRKNTEVCPSGFCPKFLKTPGADQILAPMIQKEGNPLGKRGRISVLRDVNGCVIFFFELPDVHQADTTSAGRFVSGKLLYSKLQQRFFLEGNACVGQLNDKPFPVWLYLETNFAGSAGSHSDDRVFQEIRQQVGYVLG